MHFPVFLGEIFKTWGCQHLLHKLFRNIVLAYNVMYEMKNKTKNQIFQHSDPLFWLNEGRSIAAYLVLKCISMLTICYRFDKFVLLSANVLY